MHLCVCLLAQLLQPRATSVCVCVCVYPLLLRIHVSDAKIILLQQTVVVTYMIQQELTFCVSLQKRE